MLQQALQIWRQYQQASGSKADHARLLSNLAQAVHGLKDHARAEQLYREAQTELEALFPEGNGDLASTLGNRALLAEETGDRAGALALYRQSLAMRERVFRGDHPSVATGLAQVARLSAANGDAAAALPIAKRAAEMADRIYPDPNPRHASVYATLSEVRLANGDVPAATTSMTRALALLAKVQTHLLRLRSIWIACGVRCVPSGMCSPIFALSRLKKPANFDLTANGRCGSNQRSMCVSSRPSWRCVRRIYGFT